MHLAGYVEAVEGHFAAAAEVGGEESRQLAERLFAPLQAAIRLSLQEALVAAAEEITVEMAPGSVEVRLRAGQIEFVVTPAEAAEAASGGSVDLSEVAEAGDEISRVNVRMPEGLKARIDEAASREGISVNAWLVRAAATAAASADRGAPVSTTRRSPKGPQHYTGWTR